MSTPDTQTFQVVPADYSGDFQSLRKVRETVFVQEQQVPIEEEWDALDPLCHHVLAIDLAGNPIGTGRLTPERKIGRMAVLAPWRGHRVGQALLQALIDQARTLGWDEVSLHAQVSAEGFYARAGFVAEGGEFMEAGIRHRTMRRSLDPLPAQPPHPGARPGPESVPAVEIESMREAIEATLAVIQGAPRGLCLYSRDGDLPLLGDARVIDALRACLTAHRDARLRVIVQAPRSLSSSHPLVGLAQRLSSRIELRAPQDPVDLNTASAWIAAERGGFLFRPLASRPGGETSPMAPARARQLIAEFDPVWERSRVLSEFRVLGL